MHHAPRTHPRHRAEGRPHRRVLVLVLGCLLDVACVPSGRPRQPTTGPARIRPTGGNVDSGGHLWALQSPDARARAKAVTALRCHAKPRVIRALVAVLGDGRWARGGRLLTDGWHPVGLLASDALACTGAPAIRALVAVLSQPDSAARRYATRALRRIEYPSRPGDKARRVRALLRASRDRAPEVRVEAIAWTSLRRDVVFRQVALLRDPDPRVRWEARARVIDVVQNPNLSRAVARKALRAVDPTRSLADFSRADGCGLARAPLRCRLRHRNPQVRGDAIPEAQRLGRVATLVALLGDPYGRTLSRGCTVVTKSVGDWAGAALVDLGAVAVPGLVRTLAAGSPWARRNAAESLSLILSLQGAAKLGRTWQGGVLALVRASRDPQASVVTAAVGSAVHDLALLKRQLALLRAPTEAVRVAAWRGLDDQRYDKRWPAALRARIVNQLQPTP